MEDAETLDVVVVLGENCGPLLDVVAGSVEIADDVSWDVEGVSDALVGAEEVVSCVVEGVDADVSKEEDAAIELETLSKVDVGVG